MTFLYPKPVRQPKVRKPLLRKKPLLAKVRRNDFFMANIRCDDTPPASPSAIPDITDDMKVATDGLMFPKDEMLLFPKPKPRQRVPRPLKRSTKPIRRTRLKWRKKRDKRMEDWHKAVCDRSKVADNVYICFHCGGHFQQNEVCGDHFPFPRSVRPDLKYNVENGVPSCWACNQKDSKKRAASLDYWEKTGNVVPAWKR